MARAPAISTSPLSARTCWSCYSLDGFFVPWRAQQAAQRDDPDIAPALVPLRERLMAMVGRPVNIQVTRDIVMFLRGDLLGQPYLTLVEKAGA